MTESFTPPQDPSALAADLVASGAQPVQVDADALLAQIQALQTRVDSLSVQAGVPADPKEAARTNLLAHAKAHAAANPTAEFGDLVKAVEDPSVSPEVVGIHVEDVVARHRHLDLAYLAELGRDFRKAMAR